MGKQWNKSSKGELQASKLLYFLHQSKGPIFWSEDFAKGWHLDQTTSCAEP